MTFPAALLSQAEAVLAAYRRAGLTVATAESCTGGLVAGCLTEIAGSSDVLTFVAVAQDSRCPSDAVCVWAGEAVLAFVLHEDGLASGRSIAVSPGASAAAVLGSYRLTVLDVQPEATTAGQIAQSDYRATVALERAGSPPGSGVRGVVTLGPLCPVQRGRHLPIPTQECRGIVRDPNEAGRKWPIGPMSECWREIQCGTTG